MPEQFTAERLAGMTRGGFGKVLLQYAAAWSAEVEGLRAEHIICAHCGCLIPRGAAKSGMHGKLICVDYAVASGCRYMAEIDELQAEVKRLRAIVDDLPKTTDGVPVSKRMELWFWHNDKIKSWACPGPHITGITLWDKEDEDDFETKFVENCYSTREAAEAAGGEA